MTSVPSPSSHGLSTWRSTLRLHQFLPLPLRRLALTTLACGLLAALFVLIARPWLHARTRIITLELSGPRVAGLAPLPNTASGRAALEAIQRSFVSASDLDPSASRWILRTSADLAAFGTHLEQRLGDDLDVLIVSITARGISDDGRAYLLAPDFDPQSPTSARVLVEDVLRQVASAHAACKILLLDACTPARDPRLGFIINEFPRLLAHELSLVHDPGLWVVASHGILEQSHWRSEDRRTVFEYYTSRGLAGDADLDGNRTVDLAELYRYSSAHVARWVRRHSANALTQTPQLLGPSTEPLELAAAIQLVPVPRGDPLATVANRVAKKAAKPKDKTANRKPATKDPGAAPTPPAPSAPVASSTSATAPAAPSSGKPETLPGKSDPATASAATDPGSAPVTAQVDPKVDAASSRGATQAASEPAPANVATAQRAASAMDHQATADELLRAAWRLRDALQARAPGSASPVDDAPHAWREFQEGLLSLEWLWRSGDSADARLVESELLEYYSTLAEQLALSQPRAIDPQSSLVERLARLQARWDAWEFQPPALTWGSRPALSFAGQDQARATRLLETIEAWSTRADREGLDPWLAGLSDAEREYVEIQTALDWSRVRGLDWKSLSTLWRTRLLAERANSQPWSLPWYADQLRDANELCLACETDLRESWDHHSRVDALRRLERARRAYEEVLVNSSALRAAWELRNDLLFNAASLVELAAGLECEPLAAEDRHADLLAMLEALRDLSDLFSDLARTTPEELFTTYRRLVAADRRVRDSLIAGSLDKLQEGSVSWRQVHRRELLLRSTLLGAADRDRLWSQAASARDPDPDSEPRLALPPAARAIRASIVPNWDAMFRRAECELALVQLIALDAASLAPDERSPEASFARLRAASRRRARGGGRASEESLWTAYRDFGKSIQAVYLLLPGRILDTDAQIAKQAVGKNGQSRARLYRTECWSRLLDVQGASRIGVTDLAGRLRRERLADSLEWQAQRASLASQEASLEARDFLARVADRYAWGANLVADRAVRALDRAACVQVECAGELELADDAPTDFVLHLQNPSATTAEVRLVLDYDPSLLRIVAPRDQPVHALVDGQDPWQLAHAARLAARESQELHLRIEPLAPRAESTRLVVRAYSAKSCLRSTVEVKLPGIPNVELVLHGVDGTWQSAANEISLSPFPNQTSEFRLGLVNRSDVPRTVRVSLASAKPAAPRASAVTPGRYEVDQVLAEVPELKLPNDGREVRILFPPPVPPAAAPAGGVPSLVDPRVEVSSGLWLVVTETATGRCMTRFLSIAPLRPASYLRATCAYDPARDRLEVRVVHVDPSRSPPGGTRLRLTLDDPDQERAVVVEGELKPDDLETRLHAQVQHDPTRKITVWLAADDFPRAFVFSVPSSVTSSEILPLANLCDVRLALRESSPVRAAPLESVAVDLQVDASAGSLRDPRNVLELGFDENRDRELSGERRLRLATDRQVDVRYAPAEAPGDLRLAVRVSDYHLQLDARGLLDVRANLLARLVVGDQSAWSEPPSIVLDATPPWTTRIDLDVEQGVVLGAKLQATILAGDASPGQVSRVEAIFDLNQTGCWDPQAKPALAEREPSGRWRLTIPTEGLAIGTQWLLVRAVDRAAHASEVRGVPVRVLSPEEALVLARASGATVSGVVLYDSQPQASIRVWLESDPTCQTMTNQQGRFRLSNVPAAKQKILARGVVRNKERQAEAEITLEPGAAKASAVQLQLP